MCLLIGKPHDKKTYIQNNIGDQSTSQIENVSPQLPNSTLGYRIPNQKLDISIIQATFQYFTIENGFNNNVKFSKSKKRPCYCSAVNVKDFNTVRNNKKRQFEFSSNSDEVECKKKVSFEEEKILLTNSLLKDDEFKKTKSSQERTPIATETL
jgi:hypothetical protein